MGLVCAHMSQTNPCSSILPSPLTSPSLSKLGDRQRPEGKGERVETVPSRLVVSEEEDIMMRSMAAVVSVDAEVYRGTSMPADH